MRNRYRKAVIEDLVAENLPPEVQVSLLDFYEYLVKEVADSRAREARFELDDFARAAQRGISGFALTVVKHAVANGFVCWHGTFERQGQRLFAVASIEDY
jgi:hypothetical protein